MSQCILTVINREVTWVLTIVNSAFLGVSTMFQQVRLNSPFNIITN